MTGLLKNRAQVVAEATIGGNLYMEPQFLLMKTQGLRYSPATMTDQERTEGLIGRWQGCYRPDNGSEENHYIIDRCADGTFRKSGVDIFHEDEKFSRDNLSGRWRVEDDELIEESDVEGENRYKILLIDENEFHSQWLDGGHPDPYVLEEERTDLTELPDPPEDYEEW